MLSSVLRRQRAVQVKPEHSKDLPVVAARLTDADRTTIRTLAASLHELGEIQRECCRLGKRLATQDP